MAVSTTNIYGNIMISDDAIARVAAHAVLDSYGIVELVSRGLKDSFDKLFNKKTHCPGVKIVVDRGKININVFVIVKFGVSLSAVAESLKQNVKYTVEKFSGMVVGNVDVNIVGVKL